MKSQMSVKQVDITTSVMSSVQVCCQLPPTLSLLIIDSMVRTLKKAQKPLLTILECFSTIESLGKSSLGNVKFQM